MSSDAGGSGDDFELVDQVKIVNECVAPSSSARTEEKAFIGVRKDVGVSRERPTSSSKGPGTRMLVKPEAEDSDGEGDNAAGTSPPMQDVPRSSGGDNGPRLSRLATLLIGLSLGLSALVPMNLWASNLVSRHSARHSAASRALQQEHVQRAQHAAALVHRLQGAVESVWIAGNARHPSLPSSSVKSHLSAFSQELRHLLARVACTIPGTARNHSPDPQSEPSDGATAECESLQLLQHTFLLRVLLPSNTTFHPYPLPPTGVDDDSDHGSSGDSSSSSSSSSSLELIKVAWLSLLTPPLPQPQGSPDSDSEVLVADDVAPASHPATSAPPALPAPPGHSTICWTGATGVFCHTVFNGDDFSDARGVAGETMSALTAVLSGPSTLWSTFVTASKLPCGSELEILAPGHHIAHVTCSTLFGKGACCAKALGNAHVDSHKGIETEQVDNDVSGSDDDAHALSNVDHTVSGAHTLGSAAARVAKVTRNVLSGTSAAVRDATQKAAAAATAGGARAAAKARRTAVSLARLSHTTSAVVCNSTLALTNRVRASGAAVSDKLRGSSAAMEESLRHSGAVVGNKVAAVGDQIRHEGTTIHDKLSAASWAFGNTVRRSSKTIRSKVFNLMSAVGSGLRNVRHACDTSAAAIVRRFQEPQQAAEQKAISPGIAVGDVLANVEIPAEPSIAEVAHEAAAGARNLAQDYTHKLSTPFAAAKSRVAEWQAARQGKRDAAEAEATRKEWEAVKRTIHEAEEAVRAANHAEQQAVADQPASSLPLAQQLRLAAIAVSDRVGAWGSAVRKAVQPAHTWRPLGAKRHTWPEDM